MHGYTSFVNRLIDMVGKDALTLTLSVNITTFFKNAKKILEKYKEQ
jgi:hypothetical protein